MDTISPAACGTLASVTAVLLLATHLDKDRGLTAQIHLWRGKRWSLDWWAGWFNLSTVLLAVIPIPIFIIGLASDQGLSGGWRYALLGPFAAVGALLTTVLLVPIRGREAVLRDEVDTLRKDYELGRHKEATLRSELTRQQLEQLSQKLEILIHYQYFLVREMRPDVPAPWAPPDGEIESEAQGEENPES